MEPAKNLGSGHSVTEILCNSVPGKKISEVQGETSFEDPLAAMAVLDCGYLSLPDLFLYYISTASVQG